MFLGKLLFICQLSQQLNPCKKVAVTTYNIDLYFLYFFLIYSCMFAWKSRSLWYNLLQAKFSVSNGAIIFVLFLQSKIMYEWKRVDWN